MKKREKLYLSFLLILGSVLCISIVGLLSGNDEYTIKQYNGSGQGIQASVITEQIESAAFDSENSSSELFPCVISKNVDGDTIYVVGDIFDDETKIRFIGVNTPESVSPDEEKNCNEGREASDYTSDYLVPGMQIYLEFDEDRMDQYGRTLAYVWVSDNIDPNSYSDFCTYNYGAILLQNTYCEATYYAPNGKYKEWYEQLEKEFQK